MEQKLRRRNGFQAGVWVLMGDRQRWMFPPPPLAGTDHEYDALLRCLLEAEDRDEAHSIELALGILLFSRNYDPQPSDYQAVFDFGADSANRSTAEAAIAALIYEDLEKRLVPSRPVGRRSGAFPAIFRTLQTFCASTAARFRAPITLPVHFASARPRSTSQKVR